MPSAGHTIEQSLVSRGIQHGIQQSVESVTVLAEKQPERGVVVAVSDIRGTDLWRKCCVAYGAG